MTSDPDASTPPHQDEENKVPGDTLGLCSWRRTCPTTFHAVIHCFGVVDWPVLKEEGCFSTMT